jgi:hypothetical protein
LELPDLPRHRQDARTVADSGFHDLSSDPSAPADHDRVLAGQRTLSSSVLTIRSKIISG